MKLLVKNQKGKIGKQQKIPQKKELLCAEQEAQSIVHFSEPRFV